MRLLANLLVFGRLLRGARPRRARRAPARRRRGAAAREPRRARDEVYHTCRALLVHRHEDLAVFDRAFDAFWRAHGGTACQLANAAPGEPRPEDPRRRGARPSRCAAAVAGDADRRRRRPARCGRGATAAALAHKDFAEFTADEMAPARRASRPARLDSRRTPDAPVGSRARAAHRSAARARARACAPAATSSSCRAAGAGCGRVRSCCSATSAARWSATRACCCTSPTRSGAGTGASRRSSSPPAHAHHRRSCAPGGSTRASPRSSRAVPDWSGGTRIGEALRAVPSALGRRVLARRSRRAAHLRWLGSRRSGACCATRSRGCSGAAIG